MKFLSKLGDLALKAITVITGFAPQPTGTSMFGSGQTDTLTKIRAVIEEVEVFGQALSLKGPDKLIAVTPLVVQLILKSDMIAGHKIEDEDLFRKGVVDLSSAIADIVNSLDADKISKS